MAATAARFTTLPFPSMRSSDSFASVAYSLAESTQQG